MFRLTNARPSIRLVLASAVLATAAFPMTAQTSTANSSGAQVTQTGPTNSAEKGTSQGPSWIYHDEVAPAVSWFMSLEKAGPLDIWQKFLNIPLGAYDTWNALQHQDPTVSPFSLESVKQVTADTLFGIGPALVGLGPLEPKDPISLGLTGGAMIEAGIKHSLNQNMPGAGEEVEELAKSAAMDTIYGTPSWLSDFVSNIVAPGLTRPPFCTMCAPYQEPGSASTVLDAPLNPFPESGTVSGVDALGPSEAQRMLQAAKQAHDVLLSQEQQLLAQSADYEQQNELALQQSQQALEQSTIAAQTAASLLASTDGSTWASGSVQPGDFGGLLQLFGGILNILSRSGQPIANSGGAMLEQQGLTATKSNPFTAVSPQGTNMITPTQSSLPGQNLKTPTAQPTGTSFCGPGYYVNPNFLAGLPWTPGQSVCVPIGTVQ